MNKRQRLLGRLILLNLVLLGLSLVWYARGNGRIQIALAKSGANFYAYTLPGVALDQNWVRQITLADPQIHHLSTQGRIGFINAVRLGQGESRPWAAAGCGPAACVHATLYNYTQGGTIEAIVNLDTAEIIATWANPLGRPGGSFQISDAALEIAAADTAVQALLGDVRQTEQVMIPMSGWLADDDCRQDWCVDLTYMDPADTGRVVHIFVNMVQQQVARIFYTRGRADIAAAAPVMQRSAFTNDCHEQYGWQVCWEMTAHDGVLFQEATYNGRLIFSSAKIAQIEAWYPSWPGGYRDEIGFNASVPPFGDTQINDLGNGFEVRQLFTEFTRWPNCICCYRYEEVIHFYADGTFEPRFVSHGPGCDDLSVYRPFWRIDLDLNGPTGDMAWVWQGGEWTAVTRETELHPLLDEVAADGSKLAIGDDEMLYVWQFQPTDPLGLDEAYLFLLHKQEGEGEGPVLTGPGDTYQPPRQWLNEESLADGDLVLWFVPLLKTKKTAPLWCMPDPEPGLNQCEAILRIAPASQLPAAPVPTPTPEIIAETAVDEATPTPTATPAPTPTPRPVQGAEVTELILNAGCGACHAIGTLGEQHKVGPDLTNVADLAAQRVPGLSAADYLDQSIRQPNAFIAPECPNGDCLANVMPQDYSQRLTDDQIEQIVAYLLSDIQPAPTPAPIGANAVRPTPKAIAKTSPYMTERQSAMIAVQILLVTLVFLLTLFRLAKERP